MNKFKAIDLSENTKISLRVPVNTEKIVNIDVLVNGKVYGSLSIHGGMTGEFDFGEISYLQNKKKPILRWKFPLQLTRLDIGTSGINARFERKEK